MSPIDTLWTVTTFGVSYSITMLSNLLSFSETLKMKIDIIVTLIVLLLSFIDFVLLMDWMLVDRGGS